MNRREGRKGQRNVIRQKRVLVQNYIPPLLKEKQPPKTTKQCGTLARPTPPFRVKKLVGPARPQSVEHCSTTQVAHTRDAYGRCSEGEHATDTNCNAIFHDRISLARGRLLHTQFLLVGPYLATLKFSTRHGETQHDATRYDTSRTACPPQLTTRHDTT